MVGKEGRPTRPPPQGRRLETAGAVGRTGGRLGLAAPIGTVRPPVGVGHRSQVEGATCPRLVGKATVVTGLGRRRPAPSLVRLVRPVVVAAPDRGRPSAARPRVVVGRVVQPLAAQGIGLVGTRPVRLRPVGVRAVDGRPRAGPTAREGRVAAGLEARPWPGRPRQGEVTVPVVDPGVVGDGP